MLKNWLTFLVGVVGVAFPMSGYADVMTEWNLKTAQFTVAGRLPHLSLGMFLLRLESQCRMRSPP
jgi:hypothetical protein